MSLSVVYSHAARQGNVPERPAAAYRAGLDAMFLTGLYFKPDRLPYSLANWLPDPIKSKALKELRKRRVPDLPDERVFSVSGPWPELLFRHLRWYGAWNGIHDWLASRWIRKWVRARPASQPPVFHGFQGCCLQSLAVAKECAMITAVEVTQPLNTNSIVAHERTRLGLPAGPTLASSGDVEEVKQADFIIVQSEWSAVSVREVKPNAAILEVLPGVDTDLFHPPATPQEGFNFIFAGQLCVRKGLHHLLQAWSELSLPGAKLWIAGSPTDEIGKRVLESPPPSVEFLGFQPATQLAELYRSSHVFVGPSLSEAGFSSVYEAAASGLPCIVSDRAGSLIRDGVEGFVVEAGDMPSLGATIQRLYADADLRLAMGRAARRRAEQFQWRDFGRRLAGVYEQMLLHSNNFSARAV